MTTDPLHEININEQVELDVLRHNYARGTCVGEPASEEQQDLRARRIAELSDSGKGEG